MNIVPSLSVKTSWCRTRPGHDVIATCLNIQWLPVAAAIISAVQAVRTARYAVRAVIEARVYFTALWSVCCGVALVWANTVGSYHASFEQHAICISGSMVVLGWIWSAQGVINFRSSLTFVSQEHEVTS